MVNPFEVLERHGMPTNNLSPADAAKLEIEFEKLHLERERMAHSRWWHEDMLVNQRLTWLLTSQTVLLAGYGLLVKGSSVTGEISPEAAEFAKIFPAIGFAVSVLIALGISAAWSAQRMLRSHYSPLGLKVGVSKATTRGGRIPAHGLPFLFVTSWGWLFDPWEGAVLAFVMAGVLILAVEWWLKSRFNQGLQDLRDQLQSSSERAANPAAQPDVFAAG